MLHRVNEQLILASHHELLAGPGVGKGRQIASLVFENILRGRTKVLDLKQLLTCLFTLASSVQLCVTHVESLFINPSNLHLSVSLGKSC